MGFVVQVWESPAGAPRPRALQDALEQAERIDDRPGTGPASTRLLAFRAALLDRYPAAPDLGVWHDDALLRVDGRAPLVVLGVTTEFADEVVTWMADAGPNAGLNVADPQSGSVWLADGTVFAQHARGACARAFARLEDGDDRAAWERFVALAEAGHALAFNMLAEMTQQGRYVGRDAATACALRCAAAGWRVDAGVACPAPGDADPSRTQALLQLRERLGAAELARADALLPRLLEPGRLHAALREAGGPADARHAQALALADAGDAAGAAARLQVLASAGHAPSQRALVRLWAAGAPRGAAAADEIAWTRSAAAAKDDAATMSLARLLATGRLVPRDLREARRLLRGLARSGRSAAMRAAAQAERDRLKGPADAAGRGVTPSVRGRPASQHTGPRAG